MSEFECVECGYATVKWLGRCPSCNEWNTIVETSKFKTYSEPEDSEDKIKSDIIRLNEVKIDNSQRVKSGIRGFDSLMGGGFVEGETILLGGPPGVGKSTLFLQIAGSFSRMGKNVLYISGEENPSQIKIHASRLGINGDKIVILTTSDLNAAREHIEKESPQIIMVDSIQAVAIGSDFGAPGSVKQVKRSTSRLVSIAKNSKSIVFISGQITKDGSIAGPKVLEHMVDAVAYMDSPEPELRIVHTAKNRFGPCGDFIIYRMCKSGLKENINLPGSVESQVEPGESDVTIKIGSRFQNARIQALVTESYFEYPLRRTSGFSRERLLMLSAIASRHLGLKFSSYDIYLNVGGGVNISERSADLGVLAALYSNIKNIPPPPGTLFIGETGLAGEVSPVLDIERRLNFARRNNFSRAVIPEKNGKVNAGLETFPISKVSEINKIIKQPGS